MLLLCLQHGYLPLHAYLATHECPSAEAVKTLLAAYPDAAQTADDVRCSPSCVIFCASGSHRLVPTACSLQAGCLPLHLALKQPDVGVLAVQALIDAHREAVGFANGEVCVCVWWWWWCHSWLTPCVAGADAAPPSVEARHHRCSGCGVSLGVCR